MKNGRRLTVFIFIFFVLLFLANRIFFFKPSFLERWSANISYPFLVVADSVAKPFRYFLYKRKRYENLLALCQKLEKEREEVFSENIKLKSLIRYDQLSKDLVEFRDRYKLENSILSKILLRSFSKEEHSFIINRGSRDGVEKNMVAIYKFQILGNVTDVFANHSKVRLITDSFCKISAFTNESNASGIVQGCNVINRCQLKYVSHLEKIYPEDLVISSGKGMVFPEGFCLGRVINFETKDICYLIDIETLVDFQTIDMCLLTNQAKMNPF